MMKGNSSSDIGKGRGFRAVASTFAKCVAKTRSFRHPSGGEGKSGGY